MPQIDGIAADYADQGVVVLGINYRESQTIVQNYQNNYPNILMLKDTYGTVYNLYRQNGYIPLNYVLDHDLRQTVDYWMEGYSHATIVNRINNLLSDVTLMLVPDAESFSQGGTVGFDLNFTNWNTTDSKSFLVALDVKLPSGGYLFLDKLPVQLDPGEELTLRQDIPVPGNAPLNTYMMRARLGLKGDLWNGDSFHFEIVP